MKLHFLALVPLALAACATPVGYSNKPLQTYDKDTEYRVDEAPGGFTVSIYYSRYQFVSDSSGLLTACKSALTNIAYEHAESLGKTIEPINEQRIKLSTGRNGLSGVTSCSASVTAKFKG